MVAPERVLAEGTHEGMGAVSPMHAPDRQDVVALELEDRGPLAEGVEGPRSAVDQLVADVALPLAPPIIPRPTLQKRAPRRRRSPISNPRRSGHLASQATATLNAVARPQHLIM